MEETETTSKKDIASDSISYESSPTNDLSAPTAGIISRVASGAYNTTATILGTTKNVATPIIGNASWITGIAFSSSVGLAKNVGSLVLPKRFQAVEAKDKSD